MIKINQTQLNFVKDRSVVKFLKTNIKNYVEKEKDINEVDILENNINKKQSNTDYDLENQQTKFEFINNKIKIDETKIKFISNDILNNINLVKENKLLNKKLN